MKNKGNRDLKLTLKKEWFDKIYHGFKKEEYREIKPYWTARLMDGDKFKVFDTITFRNGYSKNAPEITLDFDGICIDTGYVVWGAEPDKEYYCIALGPIRSYKNTPEDE